jgi:hypothetical protein
LNRSPRRPSALRRRDVFTASQAVDRELEQPIPPPRHERPRRTASRRSSYVVPSECAPALAAATTTTVPITTTLTLKAWSQKPHSSVIPSPPNVASRIMRPVHVNDHATTVAASMDAAVRGLRLVTPAIARNATVATRRTGRGASRCPSRGSRRPATLLVKRDRLGTRAETTPVVRNETQLVRNPAAPARTTRYPIFNLGRVERPFAMRSASWSRRRSSSTSVKCLRWAASSWAAAARDPTHPWVQVSQTRPLGAPGVRAARRAYGLAGGLALERGRRTYPPSLRDESGHPAPPIHEASRHEGSML